MPITSVLSRQLQGLALVAATLVTAAAPASAGQGDLLVAPTRVVINNGGGAEVVLNNIGSKDATYRISLELRRMSAEGNLVDVSEAEANALEKAALEMIRYAPRRITLPPNQPQSIRISARPPAELPDGEYRVHMAFRGIPDAITVEEAAKQQTGSGLSIRLTPIYGVTIPVIIRKGGLQATASLANPRIERGVSESFLTLDMQRQGGRSVFGELIVKPKGSNEIVFNARGIAVYPELTSRTLHLQLSPEQAEKLRGPLSFEYRELPENGGKLIASIDANMG